MSEVHIAEGVDSSRLSFIEVPPKGRRQNFPCAVMTGLSQTQKSLPCRFFYDSRGSDLFEQITALPEYYLTRCEAEILEAFADEVVQSMGRPFSMVEFGSGSSAKTRYLLSAAVRAHRHLSYSPIDISRDFLKVSSEALLGEYEGLTVRAIASEYFDAMTALPESGEPRLILFLGSNIGNFEPCEAQEFLGLIAERMRPQDRLLIGKDLVKSPQVIEAAYNDAAGVTAAFNKNLLVRINRELGGHFNLDQFDHIAPFLAEKERVEMRLVSCRDQEVEVEALEAKFQFRQGEYIHTENCCKYSSDSFDRLCAQSGLHPVRRWLDQKKLFSVVLLEHRI